MHNLLAACARFGFSAAKIASVSAVSTLLLSTACAPVVATSPMYAAPVLASTYMVSPMVTVAAPVMTQVVASTPMYAPATTLVSSPVVHAAPMLSTPAVAAPVGVTYTSGVAVIR